MDSVLISSPVGGEEIKKVMVVEREGRGASGLLVQPSAFFAGPPSLILLCESTGEFSFCLAITFYAYICTWTGQGIQI